MKKAAAGEVLVTRTVAELAGEVRGIRFEERGTADLKGFERDRTATLGVYVPPAVG